ncbi:hypothetical protein ACFXHA_44630 [Nocardia sp. NPDC059240]|uniref:hypothetical protein n=1 Tax=Nocardia sp. NPDC059240 TaxID=3346786 RepID=UPI00369C9DAD
MRIGIGVVVCASLLAVTAVVAKLVIGSSRSDGNLTAHTYPSFATKPHDLSNDLGFLPVPAEPQPVVGDCVWNVNGRIAPDAQNPHIAVVPCTDPRAQAEVREVSPMPDIIDCRQSPDSDIVYTRTDFMPGQSSGLPIPMLCLHLLK